jgi:hypothetical protein
MFVPGNVEGWMIDPQFDARTMDYSISNDERELYLGQCDIGRFGV